MKENNSINESSQEIIEYYLKNCLKIFELLISKNFWNCCNTDEEGKYLFVVETTQFTGFNLGAINLEYFSQLEGLLQTEILFMFPNPPGYQSNLQFDEFLCPKLLYEYQPSPQERYNWTLEFAKIIDCWLAASLNYKLNDFQKSERLEIFTNFINRERIAEACKKLNFSPEDAYIEWNESQSQNYNLNKQVALFERFKFTMQNIIDNYNQRLTNSIKAISSQRLWQFCNTYIRGQYLFFIASEQQTDNEWMLIDVQESQQIQKVKEKIPGLIQVPIPPTFCNIETSNLVDDFPLWGYQPSVEERYKWTLELSKRIDSWLIAIVSYEATLLTKPEQVKILEIIYRRSNIIEFSTNLQFSLQETQLKWSK
ncbi:hypothetical protein C7H19_08585 [Aphanothece hegewaldii CCALA 016]|uniref:Uncharacterized protein n=1 Tax=Aphanothece hegewaldii CCALA 016 TaxID=2107694 RepID=A0A2T1LYX2_9CHRO|nr:hypothetical protein [Aphanothece hegewaldii]PSF37604.1 hypothetical protein C7H19_08585 [Aphanothece hegewaldii CCALA 016]